MALPTTLPPWLTQSPDPAAIIGRGTSAGAQAADARMAAQRLMAQQQQFAQEVALRKAAAEREAQQQAAIQDQRQEELEIRRTLAESEIAKEGRMAAATMMTAQQKARQAADALALQYDIEKNKQHHARLDRALKIRLKGMESEQQGKAGEQAAALGMRPTRISPAGTTYEVPKKDEPEDDKDIKKLERELRGAEAELQALESDSGTDPDEIKKLRLKIENYKGQLGGDQSVSKETAFASESEARSAGFKTGDVVILNIDGKKLRVRLD